MHHHHHLPHPRMEALKRRLNVLTSELAPAPSVALLGLPSPDELWALPSVVGLGNLLAAHRTVVCLRAATEASEAALRHVPTDVALVCSAMPVRRPAGRCAPWRRGKRRERRLTARSC